METVDYCKNVNKSDAQKKHELSLEEDLNTLEWSLLCFYHVLNQTISMLLQAQFFSVCCFQWNYHKTRNYFTKNA